MDATSRRQAVKDYKESKSVAGIYAVRCQPTGECWVGRALDLAAVRNRIRFSLDQGVSANAALQAAMQAHGAKAFVFEVLEAIEDEEIAFVRDRTLQDRLAHWLATLGARRL